MSSLNDRAWVKDFIELYHSEPCLWKVKSKAYKDTQKKEEAYDKLIKKFHEVEPQANKEKVLEEINTLRCDYKVELRKVWATRSELTGIETYEPELWYFPFMRFLDNEEKAQDLSEYQNTDSDEDEESRHPQPSCSEDGIDLALDIGHEDDFHDLYGKMIAIKLAKMSEDQRGLAEKMIDGILNDATCGKLTEHHCLVDAEGVRKGDGSVDEFLQNIMASATFHSLDLNQQQQDTDDVEMEEEN